MNSESQKVYLIDGSGYIFRAYYAVLNLSTKAGFPTNALFGFLKMLLKLLKTPDAKNIAIVFDAGRDTFRQELYPEYKANREDCPEDLKPQMPFFREFSNALGLPVFEQKGYEADDIIATLAKKLKDSGHDVVVVSGDKDLMQLVDDQLTIWDTMKDKHYDANGVIEKMGVPPHQIVELLGLMGDTSDNVPGIKGVGPKTAQQLLQICPTVEQLIDSTAKIREDKSIRSREKVAEAIELNKDLLRLSRQLVEVKYDVPVEINKYASNGTKTVQLAEIEDSTLVSYLKRGSVDQHALKDLIQRFEFGSLFKDFNFENQEQPKTKLQSYNTVNASQYDEWLKNLLLQQEVAFDLETTSLDTKIADIVGLSFCWNDSEAWYIPVGHTGVLNANFEQVDVNKVISTLKPFFENSKVRKIGQNLKYDAGVLARYNIIVTNIYFDTMLASYVLDPDRESHGLTALADTYLQRTLLEYKEIVGAGSDFSETEIIKACEYAGQDAHVAWLLYKILAEKLVSSGLQDVFATIEMPLLPVLLNMELAGVALDLELLKNFSKELTERLAIIEAKMYELAGMRFNPNSPKQLAEVLFNRLAIPTTGLKKTKTGISTDSSVLEKLSEQYELPREILEYRSLHKLKSTYVDALPAAVSAKTGRLHTKFNQTGTATGRLSSSDPNLQNIPIQSIDGRRVRQAFIAADQQVLISADYSQIELRLLAHLSADQNMCAAFKQDLDIHSMTARQILNLTADQEVTSEQRRIGKTINFGVVYGMGGYRFARELGVPVSEGSRYIEDYFKNYSGVRAYFDKLEQQAESQGFVSTMFGRRRYLTSVNASARDPGFLQRVAINAPIQGSAADLIKLAMIKIAAQIKSQQLPLKLLLQIHDELVFECRRDFVEQASVLIKAAMENVVELIVPLKVDLGFGENWLAAH